MQRFIAEHIHGYDELELLLLAHAAPERAWTAGAAAAALGISAVSATQALEHLRAHGLLARETGAGGPAEYRASVADPGVCETIRGLARRYAERRADIVQLMNASAIERFRAAAGRLFSDAFRRGG